METQIISLGGVEFAVVFEVVDQKPKVIDKCSANQISELRAWLNQESYPDGGLRLEAHPESNLPEGFYIKPFATDRYFRVLEDGGTEEVDADQFGDEFPCLSGEF